MKKQFPQNELQEKIYCFWKVRGYEEVKAVLGNLNVSFHRKNPQHEQNGLSYQYLQQFWNQAQKEELESHKISLEIIRDLSVYEIKEFIEQTLSEIEKKLEKKTK